MAPEKDWRYGKTIQDEFRRENLWTKLAIRI